MIIGLFLRHIKAYKGINFVPIGHEYKFVSYVGENGIGKSSILESLDSFFNDKSYPINKSAISDGITTDNKPFVVPIFLIEKSKVTSKNKLFDILSNYFWSILKSDLLSPIQGSVREFFELRDQVRLSEKYNQDTHYLLVCGERGLMPYFAGFHNDENFLLCTLGKDPSCLKGDISKDHKKKIVDSLKLEFDSKLNSQEWKSLIQIVKNLYSYVYFPVEINVEDYTKIETTEMQKIFDKTLKHEIEDALDSVNLLKSGGINNKLDIFISEIGATLGADYCYNTGGKRNKTVTKSDLVNKIIEVYFQKRVLNKVSGGVLTRVGELSAGEKRQALIDLIYAFLKRNSERETMVIIAIDEPENSLHTALCYDQFEKLKEISEKNQVLITTHWYGFLPVISEGYGHFLNKTGSKINFETYDLYNYRSDVKNEIKKSKNKMPNDFSLKSTYDLVQSIYCSINNDNPYNWIICEGVSEKIYFEYFFDDEIKSKKLRVLPMGGLPQVIRLYKYLLTPMSEKTCKGKVFCLIDTDQDKCESINSQKGSITIKRLSNKNKNEKTELLELSHSDSSITDIERSLNPVIFKNVMDEINSNPIYEIETICNHDGNSDFIRNFRNVDLEDFFKINDGENKVIFAKKYTEVSKSHKEICNPEWIVEMKNFFA
jgi:predicted ATP-dependent endonuclease of OLD family